ncbi:hypothetical protein ACA910_019064 [Epithemia clementina (nom. ined.)]
MSNWQNNNYDYRKRQEQERDEYYMPRGLEPQLRDTPSLTEEDDVTGPNNAATVNEDNTCDGAGTAVETMNFMNATAGKDLSQH